MGALIHGQEYKLEVNLAKLLYLTCVIPSFVEFHFLYLSYGNTWIHKEAYLGHSLK